MDLQDTVRQTEILKKNLAEVWMNMMTTPGKTNSISAKPGLITHLTLMQYGMIMFAPGAKTLMI